MDERLINKASFSSICKILQQKKSVWEEVKPILQATMLIVPVLINKDYVTALALHDALDQGLNWLDAEDKIENAIASVKKLVSKQDEDFITRAENAQIANVLLIFSAYFDTVRQFLPDKDRNIYLDEVQYCLTEKSLKAYQEKLLSKGNSPADANGKQISEWELVLPNPLESLDEYDKRLKEFYSLLNNSFRIYIEGLSCTEDMQEHLRGELNRKLEIIPNAAVASYRAQYYSLAAICPDFFVWTTQQEHQQQKEIVDRGFRALSNQIRSIPEILDEYHATEALKTMQNWYTNSIHDPVIPSKDMPPQDRDLHMPTREEIFVPQAYEWLIYRKRISLESTTQWREGHEIGPDIVKILRSPELGAKPLLILGDPGAGKTTLCHMLAGKILCGEYHVIVLHLRDLNAELSIRDQIEQEIARTTDDSDCKWVNIARSKPKKPILLIFDGYDELLQASGKTYSNYLESIVAFQEKQWDTRRIVVRSIVTSRIVLIDKVEVPLDSVVIRLKPFNKARIDEWCNTWNTTNEAYFESRGLKKFEVEIGSKAWELAGEPLLLLMLALYDTKDNALRKHQNLQATELYSSLIQDFVEREKRKNCEFEAKEKRIQRKEIAKEIERISIAALGMYNRNRLHITSGQLEDDLDLLVSVNTTRELRDSEQLLGSFFFIHDLTTRSSNTEESDKLTAYTFLHNTFGEFLAAYYIVLQLYNLLDDLKRHVEKYEDALFSLKDRKSWFSCMSYTPLFHRPVVGQMIREWAPIYFQEKGLPIEEANYLFEELLNRELPRLLHGEAIAELEPISLKFRKENTEDHLEIMDHLAIYTNNLLSLAALITDGVHLNNIELRISRAWNKLLSLWRYSFSENDLAAFAGQYEVKQKDNSPMLIASDVAVDLKRENDRIKKLYKIYSNLQDEPSRSILGSLLGVDTDSICASLESEKLRTTAKSILLGIILERANYGRIKSHFAHRESQLLRSYPDICIREGDYGSLYAYFLVLNDIASFSEKGANYVLSLLDFELLLDVYTHCNRHHPTSTIPLLQLFDKLLPIIPDKDFNGLLDRLAVVHEFESLLTDRSINIWAHLLLQCVNRAKAGPWLNACWKLLRHADKRISDDPNYYSPETIKQLCLLSFEANAYDPDFPLEFADKVRQWIDEHFYYECISISSLPIIELLSKHQWINSNNDFYWSLEQILDEIDREPELPEKSIQILSNLLLKGYSQTDTRAWLNVCWRLLSNADRCLQYKFNFYTDDTIENLFILSLEAIKKDKHFQPVFIYKHANRIAQHILNNRHTTAEISSRIYLPEVHTYLSILIMASHIVYLSNKTLGNEKKQIYQCVELLLRIMRHEGINPFNNWKDKHYIILALCCTLHEYSEEIREFVLECLKDYVNIVGTGLSLELYRELCAIAERFNCTELKTQLAQL